MYSDKEKQWPIWIAPVLALALVLVLLAFLMLRGSDKDLTEEGSAAIQEAVQRSALQCYTVEGIFPENLRYLEENYGLLVNKRDYYITYEAFASNLPPSVIVTPKADGSGLTPKGGAGS
jgi:hypothetical protein